MSLMVVAVGGVGALAAMYFCGGGGGASKPPSELKEVIAGAVASIKTKAELNALFAQGGKVRFALPPGSGPPRDFRSCLHAQAVVYLSASW